MVVRTSTNIDFDNYRFWILSHRTSLPATPFLAICKQIRLSIVPRKQPILLRNCELIAILYSLKELQRSLGVSTYQ